FSRYADPHSPNIISPEGTQQFFEDLGLSIEDELVIAFAWKMNLTTMGYITMDEWTAGMRSLKKVIAMALWTMMLEPRYPLVSEFNTYLKEVQPVRVINKDQWQSFLEFLTTMTPDLSLYDETSAWPVLFDEFVEWKRGGKQ
ncbi:Cullin binding-domain-containing protein, partial [Dichotomocladium elegans]